MEKTIIYTKKLANYLIKKGFKCIDTEINYKKPELVIFIFEKTDALEKEILNYKQTVRNLRLG